MPFGSNETKGDNTFDIGISGATASGNASTIGTFAMVSPTSPTLPTLPTFVTQCEGVMLMFNGMDLYYN